MASTAPSRRCFTGGGNGLASIADMEPGFSGDHHGHHHHNHNHLLLSRPLGRPSSGKFSLRNLSSHHSIYSPRSARFCHGRFDDQQAHFLDSCFLCKKPLGNNKDIFMYRGDTPFCSEGCRAEQMEADEAEEKERSRLSASSASSSMNALRKKNERKEKSSPPPDNDFRTGAIVAA